MPEFNRQALLSGAFVQAHIRRWQRGDSAWIAQQVPKRRSRDQYNSLR